MGGSHESVETKFIKDKGRRCAGCVVLDRRSFLKVAAASAGASWPRVLMPPHGRLLN